MVGGQQQRLRIGVIGAGTISQSVHFGSIRRAGFELAAICDLSPSRAQQVGAELGARGVSDAHEIFDDPTIDAVLIATPGAHAALTAEAITRGKHVLAEKPLAYTAREVAELTELARTHQRIIQVGYMKMHDPLAEVGAREFAQLDGVRLIRITVAHPADEPQVSHLRMPEPPSDVDGNVIAQAVAAEEALSAEALPGASAALQTYYRNVLNGSVVHEFSLMRALGIKAPSAWTAQAVTPLDGDAPASLLATAVEDGVAYELSWNWLPEYPEYTETVEVLASNGRLEFHAAKPYVLEGRSRIVSRRHSGELREDTTFTHGHETGFLRQLDAFKTAIETGAGTDLSGARDDIAQLQALAAALGTSLGESCGTEATIQEA